MTVIIPNTKTFAVPDGGVVFIHRVDDGITGRYIVECTYPSTKTKFSELKITLQFHAAKNIIVKEFNDFTKSDAIKVYDQFLLTLKTARP